MIEVILNRINDPSYGTPMLSGSKLQRYITPEIGWLLTRMDNRVELLKRASLENQTIKTQEGVVEHLKELVKTGKEAEDKLMSKLLNERLAKATKSLIGNVKQVKSITDLDNSGSALSVETLKAYNHEVSPDSQLQELDNEVYLAKLLGNNPHSRNQEKED